MSRTCRRTTKGNKKAYLRSSWQLYNKKIAEACNAGLIGDYTRTTYWTVDKLIRDEIYAEAKEICGDEYFYWMTTPSHWNRDFNNVPKRREAKMLCKKIKSGYLDPDDVVFPTNRKPHTYYW